MSDVETKLKDATAYNPEPEISRQEFLKGLAKAVQELDQEAWARLGEKAQAWANSATEALNNNERVPEISTSKGNAKVKLPKKKPKPKTEKEPAKAAAKPPKKVKTAKARPAGAQTMIKKLVLKNPRISTDDALEQLTKKGYKATKFAVSTIRSGMRHTLKIIQEEGVDVRKLEL